MTKLLNIRILTRLILIFISHWVSCDIKFPAISLVKTNQEINITHVMPSNWPAASQLSFGWLIIISS